MGAAREILQRMRPPPPSPPKASKCAYVVGSREEMGEGNKLVKRDRWVDSQKGGTRGTGGAGGEETGADGEHGGERAWRGL